MIVFALSLLGCNSSPATPEALPPEVDDSYPEVSGVAAAEDFDPATDVVEVHFTASKTEVDYIDAGPTPVWAYNGQVPGPLIHARVGDTLRVIFTNDLPDPTTIHWHGLRIENEMDGVPIVQDPIQPGETFTYEFVLPDAGSFWYHPHVRSDEQVERGLYGPLVVHEAEDIPVDTDRYFVLDDVALRDNGRLYAFNLGGMDGMMGRQGNVLLANGQTELIEDTVQPGVVERWRIVNTANARNMFADITGADWRVVAIDGGILEEPYQTDLLRLPIGRRFDLEVIPRADSSAARLRIRLPAEIGYDSYPMFKANIEGEPVTREAPSWPAAPMDAIVPTTQTVDVDLDIGPGGMANTSWTINGVTFDEGNPIPVVGKTPTLLNVRNLSGMGHPFHLHGQFFTVLSRNGDPEDVPGRLDTIFLEPFDELELFSTFDNPGEWLGHCHILEHAELGMMTSFEVSE